MRLAPHTDGMNIFPERAAPSQTLPPGGGMGKPGFPLPLHEGCALPNPPTGWGDEETRFPPTPARGRSPPKPSHRVGGRGNPVSPYPLREGQALPRVGAWGNPVSPRPSPRAYVHVRLT